MQSRHVSVVVHRHPAAVYAYARDPAHLPRWAEGLAQGAIELVEGGIVVESPMGRVSVRFCADNHLGVLDHEVTLPSGDVVTNPLRVLAHPEGAELLFTVRQLAMSEEQLDHDAGTVLQDLLRLKTQLEE